MDLFADILVRNGKKERGLSLASEKTIEEENPYLSEDTMECPKCKRQIPDGITACNVCGWKLQKAQSEQATGMSMRARIGSI